MYCDSALTQPCDRLELRDGAYVVYLVANTSGPLHVRATVDSPGWLAVSPASIDVRAEQPARTRIEIVEPCADSEAVVTFAVSDPAYAVPVTVTGERCIRAP